MRKTSTKGIDLIKSFEAFRSRAYDDSTGVWTIGWGHTQGVRKGDVIDSSQADAFLTDDLFEAEMAVSSLVRVPLNDNEFAALVSFTFNLGAGNLKKSTLLRKLNAGDRGGAGEEFQHWKKAGGKVLAGLVRRRKAEKELFLTPVDESEQPTSERLKAVEDRLTAIEERLNG